MSTTTVWRRSTVAFALVLVLTLGLSIAGQASTPTPDHSEHHEATPNATSVCGGDATPQAATDMPTAGSPAASMRSDMEFDLMFIDMMIAHHQGAIAMAEVALERAEHEEIRTLAQDTIASQGAEIEQLQAWRDAWYADAPEMTMDQMMDMDGMMGAMMGMDDMMGEMGMMSMDPAAAAAALCAAPEPFDLAFIDAMIPHHESAIAIAEMALQHAVHPEIAELAQAIVDAQQPEIDQMTEWRAEWSR